MLLLLGSALLPSIVLGDFADPEEIIFAVRQPGRGGHWYENFGYYAFDPKHTLYGAEGRLCRLVPAQK